MKNVISAAEQYEPPKRSSLFDSRKKLSNPSENMLLTFINFYDLKLEFVMTKNPILLISIQNWILLVFDRAKRKAIKEFKEKSNAMEEREFQFQFQLSNR